MTQKRKTRVVVFTGAGVSAPSGLATFHDPDGIWSRYNVEDVATPEAWLKNPQKVTDFYNLRRMQLGKVEPNPAHKAIADLEKCYDVKVITQNVDDLHERAGSTSVLHLHGELCKVRSETGKGVPFSIGYNPVEDDERCPVGGRFRPHVVWFGESIMGTDEALNSIEHCDIIIVVGTSLQVYPAAGFAMQASAKAQKYLVDLDSMTVPDGFSLVQGSAEQVLPELVKKLLEDGY